MLDDGRVLDVANVVWCTGFRPDYGWIDFPLELEDGYPKQYRGAVESHPGLYFVGMVFLHSFSSMLILGAGRDAKRVVEHIVSRRPADARRSAARRGGRGGMIDEHWGDSVLVWNGVAASIPALVVRPASSTELEAAVRLRGSTDCESASGTTVTEGAASERRLTLDLSNSARGHHVPE